MQKNNADRIYEIYELGPEYNSGYDYDERGFFRKRLDVIKSYLKELLRFVPKFF